MNALDQLAQDLAGAPLTIVLAESDAITRAVNAGEGASIPLLPPFHVSDDDCYLVLPEDIGGELAAMFEDGDVDLLAEAMRDGLVVVGVVEKEGRGKVALHVDACVRPEALLDRMPYAHRTEIGRGADPIAALNGLDEARITVASELIDEAGLEKMMRACAGKGEHAGVSWRAPKDRKDLAGVDPTYAWSKRMDGGVGIEAVLFSEYEELVMLLRPAMLVAAEAPMPRLRAVAHA
jgi:hypothetical protein